MKAARVPSSVSISTYLAIAIAMMLSVAQRPARAEGPPAGKAFLSPVKIYEWTGNNSALGEPVIGKTLDAGNVYWDAPFALNVPIEQPFDNGKVKIYYILRERWDPESASPEKGRGFFGGNIYGIYPADGQPFEKDAVQDSSEKDSPVQLSPRSNSPPIYFLKHNNHFGAEIGKHAPFTEGDGSTRLGEYVCLTAAKPGWYVLWWQSQLHQWPEAAKELKEVKVTLVVDTMVCRDGAPSFERIEYLLGRGKQPTSGDFDDRSVRIATQEITITFKKDGWAFSRADVAVQDFAKEQFTKAVGEGSFDEDYKELIKATQKISAGGPTVDLAVRTEVTKKKPGQAAPPIVEEMSWKLEFPQVVLDHEMADVIVTPKRELTPPADPPDISGKPKWLDQWNAVVLKEGRSDMQKLFGPGSSKKEFLAVINNKLGGGEYFEKMWSDEATAKAESGKPNRTRFYQVGLPSSNLDTPEARAAFTDGKLEEPLFSTKAGPYLVTVYYKRLKDSDAIKTGGGTELTEVKPVDEKDPYWDWYAEFHKKMKQWNATLCAVQREAAITTLMLDIVRRDADLLTQSVAVKNRLVKGEDPLETPSDRVVRKAVEAAWDCVPEMPPEADPVQISEKAFALKIMKIRELGEQAKSLRHDLDELLATQLKIHDEIIKDLDNAGKIYGAKRPYIIHWQEEAEIEREQLGLRWALITSDRDGLMQELEKIKIEGVSASTRVFEAQILQSEGDAVGALVAYRSALRIDSENSAAKKGMKTLECSLLRTALAKSQGTVQIARDNFARYMKQRGFRVDIPRKPGAATQPAGKALQAVINNDVIMSPPLMPVTWPLHVYRLIVDKEEQEKVYALVTTGIVGSISAGIYDRPGAEADLLNAYEESMGKAFMGLQMLVFLREHDHPLNEIIFVEKDGNVIRVKGANTEKLRSWLPATDMHGKPWTDDAVKQLGVCIHEAARLDEVMALMQEDDISLRIAMEKQSYWTKRDIADTWWEWAGDITSAENVFMMLLPYSVSTKAPKLAFGFWTARDAAFVERLQKSGRAISGTEAVFRATGWASAINKISKTERGAKLALVINRYRDRVAKAGTLGKVGYSLTGNVAGILVSTGAGKAAEKWDLPILPLMADSLMLFAGDTAELSKYLASPEVPKDRLVKLIRDDMIPQIGHDRDLLMELRDGVWQLASTTGSKKPAGAKLPPPQETKLLGERISTITVDAPRQPQRPLGTIIDDVKAPLIQANADLQANVNSGAANAVESITDDIGGEIDQLDKLKVKANAVIDAANKPGSIATPVKTPAAPTPPQMIYQRMESQAPADWWFDGSTGYNLPACPDPHSKSAAAMVALNANDFETAERLLLEARESVLSGSGLETEMPVKYIDIFLDDVIRKRDVTLPRADIPAGEKPVHERISDDEMEAAFKLSEKNLGKLGGVQGEKFALGNGEYFVKKVTPTDFANAYRVGSDQLEFQYLVENELIRKTIYEAIGLGDHVPGVNFKYHLDADGKIVGVDLLYRGIRGVGVEELSPAQLRLLAKDVGECRVADLMVGDFDRKPANFRLHGESQLQSIDGGMGDVRGLRFPKTAQLPVNHERYMEGYLGIDHYWIRGADLIGQSPDTPEFRGIFMLEECLSYDDAKLFIERGEKIFLKGEGKAQLHEKLVADYKKAYPGLDDEHIDNMADEAMNAVRNRVRRIDQVLQRLNMRTGRPILPLHPEKKSTLRWIDETIERLHIGPQDFWMPTRRAA